jgi:thiosulfate dehydrogenase
MYDLTVRVSDPGQAGAGFEISAEGDFGHVGEFVITDAANTKNAGFAEPIHYLTHSGDGYRDSVDNWASNGHSFEFRMRWEAPPVDVGPVTFFVAGNAVNDANAFVGDNFYATYATVRSAQPGDSDGDTDVDLADFAVLQRCFEVEVAGTTEPCEEIDFDKDGLVSLVDAGTLAAEISGPTATEPAGYVLADPARGGLLYDKWWAVIGINEPAGDHPLYPETGQQSGPITYRCKECHGWDYKGRDGAYGSGSHFTGIVGVQGTRRTPQGLFDLLRADPVNTPNGHDMDAYGMSDRDLWDVVKMTREGVMNTDDYIDTGGMFLGSAVFGNTSYGGLCASCHGEDGTLINFGDDVDPEHIGGLARRNPWEFLHKTRFGHPGSPMPSLDLLRWELQRVADIGAYSETLPD